MTEIASDESAHRRGPRIMLVGSFPPPLGGTTVSLHELRQHLTRRGLPCVVVDTNPRGRGMLASALRALAAMVSRLGAVDVVSLHFSDRAAVTAAPLFWIACRLAGKPVVYRQFGGEFDRTFGSLRPWHRWVIRHTVLRSQAVLLQTRSMLAALAPHASSAHWFPTARRSTGHRYAGAFARCERAPLRCVFIGHVRRAKGVLTAAQAVAGLPGVELDVYGPLVDVDAADLVRERVRYCGVLEAQAVPATMASYDLLLFPTTYPGEGYPGTLVEAALVGLPMVASRWQSLPEMFSDEEVEFVEPGSVEALAQAIRRHGDQPALLSRRSAMLRARAAACFEADRVFDRFIDICAAALHGRVAAPPRLEN